MIPNKLEVLMASNNIIDIKTGKHYKIATLNNEWHEVLIDNERNPRWLFNVVHPIVDSTKVFTKNELEENSKMNLFISIISSSKDASTLKNSMGYIFKSSEILKRMDLIGIKSSSYFTVNGIHEKFYLDKTGLIYKKSEVDGIRNTLNDKNWFKSGYNLDTIFEIEGEIYKLDIFGRLNLPDTVTPVLSNVKIVSLS